MKVKYLMLSLLGAMALSVSAQETTTPASQVPAKDAAFARNRAGHNWFITLQGGVSAQFVGDNENADLFKDRLALAPSFSIGKYHNPFFATRLQFTTRLQFNGGHSHTFVGETANLTEIHSNYVGAHFDFMFDVVNYFAPYRENRVFHLIPWVGLGYQHKFISKEFMDNAVESGTVNAGVMFAFRLGKRVDLVFEAQAAHTNLNLNRGWDNGAYNGLLGQVSGGLNFKLGKVGFENIDPMDYDLINDLNNQVNRLRSEVEELSRRPVSCPECPEFTAPTQQAENVLTDKAVVFRFDSSKVDKDQLINLYDVAQFVKETNEPIMVIGYADPTGNSSYNEGLSERRAKAVVDVLTNTYGVPSELITVEWKGSSEQPFADNKAWNRVVIVRSK